MLFCDPTSIISTQPSKWSGTRRLLLGGAHRIAMACCLNPRASNLSSHLLARERDWLNITISRYGNQLTNWMEFWWCLMVFEFSTVSWFSYFHPTKIIGLNSARYPATFSEVRYGAITSAAELGFFLRIAAIASEKSLTSCPVSLPHFIKSTQQMTGDWGCRTRNCRVGQKHGSIYPNLAYHKFEWDTLALKYFWYEWVYLCPYLIWMGWPPQGSESNKSRIWKIDEWVRWCKNSKCWTISRILKPPDPLSKCDLIFAWTCVHTHVVCHVLCHQRCPNAVLPKQVRYTLSSNRMLSLVNLAEDIGNLCYVARKS